MDDVGPAALGRQRRRVSFHRRVRRRLVLALGEGVQRGAQHSVEQQVAGGAVSLAAVRDSIFELDVDCHSHFVRGRGGDAHQVQLHRGGHQNGIGAARQGLAEVEFELAYLVAAEDEPGAVVALDPEIDTEHRTEVHREQGSQGPFAHVPPGRGLGHGARRPQSLPVGREISRAPGERFLTDAEFARLGRGLHEAVDRGSTSPVAAAAVRVLMLARDTVKASAARIGDSIEHDLEAIP